MVCKPAFAPLRWCWFRASWGGEGLESAKVLSRRKALGESCFDVDFGRPPGIASIWLVDSREKGSSGWNAILDRNLIEMPVSELNMREFPPEFDAVYYQAIHPDLSHMQPGELADHWMQYGIKEGRQGGRIADRNQFVALIGENARVLEIGPFNRPVKTGANVRYFDVLDRDGLIQRAQKIGFEISGIPPQDRLRVRRSRLGRYKGEI